MKKETVVFVFVSFFLFVLPFIIPLSAANEYTLIIRQQTEAEPPPTCMKDSHQLPFDATMDYQCLAPTAHDCLVQTPQEAHKGTCTNTCTCIRRAFTFTYVRLFCKNKKPMMTLQITITEKNSRGTEEPPQDVPVTLSLHEDKTTLVTQTQSTKTNSKTPLFFEIELDKRAQTISLSCDACENTISNDPLPPILTLFRQGVLRNVEEFNHVRPLNPTPKIIWSDAACNYAPRNTTFIVRPPVCGDGIIQRQPPFQEHCEVDARGRWKNSLCGNKLCHTCKCICKPCKQPHERLDPKTCRCDCPPSMTRNKQTRACELLLTKKL